VKRLQWDSLLGWLVCVAVPLFFAIPFMRGQVLLFRDILIFAVPQQVTILQEWSAGRLPEWNSLLYGGVPLLAEPGSGVFYPPNLLFRWMPPEQAATAFILLHIPLAAAGAHALARTLGLGRASAAFAALGFSGSGFVLSMHGGHYYFASAAWFPAAIAALVRFADLPSARSLALASASIALMVFNGELQAVVLAAGFSLLLASVSGRLLGAARVTAACALGILLSGVQWLPMTLFSRNTVRASGLPLEQASRWSLHPFRWIEYIVSTPFGLPFPENEFWGGAFLDGTHPLPWAVSLYLGASFGILGVSALGQGLSARMKAIALVAPISLLIAAGNHLPVFSLWHRWVPLANRFRYPEKYALLTTLTLVLLAAWGLERLRAAPRRALIAAFFLGAILWVGFGVASLSAARLDGLIVRGLAQAEANGSAHQALVSLLTSLRTSALVCSGLALALLLGLRRPSVRVPLAFGIAALDILSAGSRSLSWGSASFMKVEPEYVRRVRALAPPGTAGRFLRDPSCRFVNASNSGSLIERVRERDWFAGKQNFPALFSLRSMLGYGAAEIAEKVAIFNAVNSRDPRRAERLFGAAARIECASDGSPVVRPVPDPLPRAQVLRAEVVRASDLLARLSEASFDPGKSALISEEDAVRGAAEGDGGDAAIELDSPGRARLRTAGNGGLLVFSESFADGWQARVDGARAALVRADGLWLGVPVADGEHVVELAYSTPGLQLGSALSGLGALILLVSFASGPILARTRVRTPPPALPFMDAAGDRDTQRAPS
jgi:hypothetical protein